MPTSPRWYCACGWDGFPDAMKPNASGMNTCPKCGASGGLITKYPEPEPAASVPVTRDVLVKHFKSRIQPPFATPETLAQEGFLERFETRAQKKAEDDADAILDLLTRLVPTGYALVPIEPTLAQLRAYCGALENPAAARKEMWHHAKARKRYRAMVLAAQQKE